MGQDFEIALLLTQGFIYKFINITEVIPYSLEYFLGLRSTKEKEEESDDGSDKENIKKKQEEKVTTVNIDKIKNLECKIF